jgi:hypothetical protein
LSLQKKDITDKLKKAENAISQVINVTNAGHGINRSLLALLLDIKIDMRDLQEHLK